MMEKKKKTNHKNFVKPLDKFSERSNFKTDFIKDIRNGSIEKANIIGIVNKIVQTGGPTVFMISDGTGSLPLKGFVKPGIRAYPEIEEGSSIKVFIKIEEFQGEVEGDILKVSKLSEKEHENLLSSINKIEMDRAKVVPPKFLVENEVLEKLKESFIKAATEIRLAIIQERPIIIRHHNDTDGYGSGFSLERAILPLIEEQHGSEKAGWKFFMRAPCMAPFYEIDDSIRDTALSLRNVAKFSNKMPLIIIADNGSSPEDLMAIKQGKIHGADFIVIDHHYFDEDVISSEVKVHINPFLFGESGSKYSAGMLCSELARFINVNVKNINQIPAMSGFADRIDLENPDTMEDYMKIAKKEGYTKEILSDIALVIEYVSTKVRFMEVREYIEVLFGEPRNKQKELVDLLSPYIKEMDKKGLEIGKANAKLEKIGSKNLQTIYIEDSFPGFGFFPKPGRAVGLVHDNLQSQRDTQGGHENLQTGDPNGPEEKGITNLITVGIMNTAITIRATDEANFSVHELIKFIKKKIPESFVEGGGHKNAGSINFIPKKRDEIVELLKEFISNK